ncbi:MAG: hypothetical protein QXU40_02345 [Candidatus Pacearchaeota archaeon]
MVRTVREMYIYQGINYIEQFKRAFPFLIEYSIYKTLSHNGGELCSFGQSTFITPLAAQDFLSRNRLLTINNVPAGSIHTSLYWVLLYFDNYHNYLNKIAELTSIFSRIQRIVFDYTPGVKVDGYAVDDKILVTSENTISKLLPNNLGILNETLNASVELIMNFIQLLDRADEEWLNQPKCSERDSLVKSTAEAFECSEEGSFTYSSLEECENACVYMEPSRCVYILQQEIAGAIGVPLGSDVKNIDKVKGRSVAIREYTNLGVETNYLLGYCVDSGCDCSKKECEEKDDEGNCIEEKCVEWTKKVKCEYKNWRARAGLSITEKDERNFYPASNDWVQSQFSFSMVLGHLDLGTRTTLDTCATRKIIEAQLEEECKKSGGTWNPDKKQCENCPDRKVFYKGKCVEKSIVCKETGGTYNQDTDTCSCPDDKLLVLEAYCINKKEICESEDENLGIVKGNYNPQTNDCECPQDTIDMGPYCLSKKAACTQSGGTYNPNNPKKPCECDANKGLISWGDVCVSKKEACGFSAPDKGIKAGTYDEVNRVCDCPNGTKYNEEFGICVEAKLVCSCAKNVVTNEVICSCSEA